jgi:lysophospholipase L1-like esterase
MNDVQHLVLLGDSIFDNASYVREGTPVIDHVRRQLPGGSKATLLAVDGNITVDVLQQLLRVPTDATHLAISVGGNDALQASGILLQPMVDAEQFFRELTAIQESFRNDYRVMLQAALERRLPTLVCTVYDAIPGMERWELTALSLFNDVIVREATSAGVPVVDLRQFCTEAADYSDVSSIEPSTAGGCKIARAVWTATLAHDFAAGRTVVYK